MQQIDRMTVDEYGIPSLLLMEAAASACLQTINTHFSNNLAGKRARVLCGPGNNGGDGAALARALSRAGVHTDVILFGKLENTRGDARANFEMVHQLAKFEAGSAQLPSSLSFSECADVGAWEQLASPRRAYDCIVDALFGTGLKRPLDGIYSQGIQHLEMIREARERSDRVKPLILSIDIPSGLDADRSEPTGEAVRADKTVTFTAPKPANVLPPSSFLNGELIVADIGSPSALLNGAHANLLLVEESDAREWLVRTRYAPDSYKNTHGHALVIAGSRGYTGAAALCGNAAIKTGAGLVTVATPLSVQPLVATQVMPEIMTASLVETDRGAVSDDALDYILKLAERCDVIAIGPGLSSEDVRTRNFVRGVAEDRRTPIVIDADGLNCLAPWPEALKGSDDHPIILTPHPGEMLRLMGAEDKSALGDRVSAARDFATRHQVILVLKGTRALIAAPDGRVFVNPTGNAGLGTAGAGDTLTGIITGFLAQAFATLREQADALSSTLAAVYVSSVAGDLAASELGMRAMVASDIREHLSDAIRLLDPEGECPTSLNSLAPSNKRTDDRH